MNEQFSREVLVADPLSGVTRNERKILLGMSALGIVIVKTGLVPSKISALGIEFAQTDQKALLVAVGAIVSYFLCAFLIYATSDFAAWQFRHRKARSFDYEYHKKLKSETFTETVFGPDGKRREVEADERLKESYLNHIEERNRKSDKAARTISLLRAIFEFIFPVAIATYAIVILWTYKP